MQEGLLRGGNSPAGFCRISTKPSLGWEGLSRQHVNSMALRLLPLEAS